MNSDALHRFQSFLSTGELPSIGPEPRAERRSASELNRELNAALQEFAVKPEAGRLIRSLILLHHDYLDESHSLSQEIHSADGSYLHGMMHRREPDYWNAKYWFNKISSHPAYPAIASAVTDLLNQKGERALLARLVPAGKWLPHGFVDACEAAATSNDGSRAILQAVQVTETEALLRHFCATI